MVEKSRQRARRILAARQPRAKACGCAARAMWSRTPLTNLASLPVGIEGLGDVEILVDRDLGRRVGRDELGAGGAEQRAQRRVDAVDRPARHQRLVRQLVDARLLGDRRGEQRAEMREVGLGIGRRRRSRPPGGGSRTPRARSRGRRPPPPSGRAPAPRRSAPPSACGGPARRSACRPAFGGHSASATRKLPSGSGRAGGAKRRARAIEVHRRLGRAAALVLARRVGAHRGLRVRSPRSGCRCRCRGPSSPSSISPRELSLQTVS